MSWKWSPFSEKVGGEFFFVFMDIVHHCFLRDEYLGSRSDAYSSKICWFVFQVGFHLYHYYLPIRPLIFPEKRKHILVLQCWTLIIKKQPLDLLPQKTLHHVFINRRLSICSALLCVFPIMIRMKPDGLKIDDSSVECLKKTQTFHKGRFHAFGQ